LTLFTVIKSTISDETDKFLLNYSYLFWGPLFIGTHSIRIISFKLASSRLHNVALVITVMSRMLSHKCQQNNTYTLDDNTNYLIPTCRRFTHKCCIRLAVNTS